MIPDDCKITNFPQTCYLREGHNFNKNKSALHSNQLTIRKPNCRSISADSTQLNQLNFNEGYGDVKCLMVSVSVV